MSAQPTAVRRSRRMRNHAAAALVAALIATGGYMATTTVGADAYPAATTGDEIDPSEQVMRELNQVIRALYGPQPSAAIAPLHRVRRELDQTVRGLYGPRP